MTRWLVMLVSVLLIFSLSIQANAESVQYHVSNGDVFDVVITVINNPSKAVAAIVKISYDHEVFETTSEDIARNDTVSLPINLNGIPVGQEITIPLRVQKEGAFGDYELNTEIISAYNDDEEEVTDISFSVAMITIEDPSKISQSSENMAEQKTNIEDTEESLSSVETETSESTNIMPWPVQGINRIKLTKGGSWDNSRVYGYFGPGTEFMTVADLRWSHISDPYALFTVGEYTLIDFNYPTRKDWHGRVSAFIGATSIKNRSGAIDIEELKLDSYPATLCKKTTPRFGPGEEYALISDDKYIISSSIELDGDSSVLVFFEANDWAYIELTCEKKDDNRTITGTARGWIPRECITP